MIQYQESNSQGNFNYNAYYYDNISFPYHFHKNMELLHVLVGEVELRLESRAETIAAGQYALIFSNQIHAYHTGKASKSWVGVFSQDHVAGFSAQTEGLEGNPSGFLCPDSLQAYLLETCPFPFRSRAFRRCTGASPACTLSAANIYPAPHSCTPSTGDMICPTVFWKLLLRNSREI